MSSQSAQHSLAEGRDFRRGPVLEGSSSSFIGDGSRLAAASGAQAEIYTSASTFFASSKSFSVSPPSAWVEIATSTWLHEIAISGW